MEANFVCFIENISKSSNDKNEISLQEQDIKEVNSDKIEDITIPNSASVVVLFKNQIEGRGEGGTPIIETFEPTNIKHFVITKQPYLNVPALLSLPEFPKHAAEGISGGFLLRDGTLFLVNDEMKKIYTPILEQNIDERGKVIDAKTLS